MNNSIPNNTSKSVKKRAKNDALEKNTRKRIKKGLGTIERLIYILKYHESKTNKRTID